MATLTNVTINDTGFLRIASGTTAERPGSPIAGMMRYNTTLSANEFYNGSAWIAMQEPTAGNSSTGGSITTAAGYRIHTFTSGSGTFTPVNTGIIDVLVIAGGGSGNGLGGGGGSGGYLYVQGVPVTGGTAYPTVVGAGGGALAGHGPNGNRGADSVFGGGTPVGLTAIAGGAGTGYYVPGPGPTNAGGSGGGGSGYSYQSQTFNTAGVGIVGQGHPGGFGSHYNGTPEGTHYGGGGGGGAGTQGYNRGGRYGQARGGEGQASSISGATVWRAGGGAGGAHSVSVPHGAASKGGKGGGGDSGTANGGNQPVQNGITNTGGGGGAANHPDVGTNGAGGPGVVIVRYRG